MKKIFVAGTDTGVGKTHIAIKIIQSLRAQGLATVGVKPVATGCEQTVCGLRNRDAEQLQEVSSIIHPYHRINPFAFLPPIAPHIAAEQAGENLSVGRLQEALAYDFAAEALVIEGVGGWLVPLNNHETMADFVQAENLEVVLVVAMRLGCLSHALLTVKVMQSQRIRLIGWVPNTPPYIPADLSIQGPGSYDANISTLSRWIPAPMLKI